MKGGYRVSRRLDVERRNSAESVWWKDLRDMCRGSGEDSWFKSRIRWSVGCGSKVRFWEDGWKDDGIPLMIRYSRLYLISNQHNTLHQIGRAHV